MVVTAGLRTERAALQVTDPSVWGLISSGLPLAEILDVAAMHPGREMCCCGA